MAYSYIPQSPNDISKKSDIFKSSEYMQVYRYLQKKFKRKDPIALSEKASEKKNIKVSRAFQSVITINDIKNDLSLNEVNLSFGEGSRGGRGVKNQGNQFEKDLAEDMDVWWNDDGKYKNPHTEKIIDEMAKMYKWNDAKTFEAKVEGDLNQRRPLVWQGQQIYIGKGGEPNIGATVTDITVTTNGKNKTYLSLKATGTVTFFNAGVSRYLIKDEMMNLGTVKNPFGLSLLKMLGIDPKMFARVFNSYGGKIFQHKELFSHIKKMDIPRFRKFLESGIGYGYHYIHAKRPSEIHHLKMTRQFMKKLADPKRASIFYGGKTGPGKRVDIEIETPMIDLKINIRNKQGGIYPTHIMCDYVFKSYK